VFTTSIVPPPRADQKPLEGGIGLVEGLAPADIGLAVEVAVIGLVDARDLLARLSDQRGEILPVGESVGRDRPASARPVRPAGAVIAGETARTASHSKAISSRPERAGGHVLALLDRREGGMQHVEEAPGGIEFEEGRARGTSRMSAAASPLIVR
jgi:hypothetical protein